jgi:hypothetical protein
MQWLQIRECWRNAKILKQLKSCSIEQQLETFKLNNELKNLLKSHNFILSNNSYNFFQFLKISTNLWRGGDLPTASWSTGQLVDSQLNWCQLPPCWGKVRLVPTRQQHCLHPTVWLDGARPANTCIPPSFPWMVPAHRGAYPESQGVKSGNSPPCGERSS